MSPKKKPDERKDFSEPRRGSGPRVSGRAASRGAKKKPRSTDPLEVANELMLQLDRCESEDEEMELAERALEISPDCVAALTVLANNLPSAQEALVIYDRAIETSRRLLGDEVFAKPGDSFWDGLATRPYMQSAMGRAQCLASLGRLDEAVVTARELLRLDTDDHLGARYNLAAWLLEAGRDNDLVELFQQFKENSTFWLYSQTLFAYRQEGDSERSRAMFEKARKSNVHVPDYLLDEEVVEEHIPGFYSPGETSEAAIYFADFAAGWRETPGAIPWLRKVAAQPRTRAAKGPTQKVLAEIRKLPQTFGTRWQAAAQQVDVWVRNGPQHSRPWSVLVLDAENSLIVSQELLLQEPTPAALFHVVSKGMRQPIIGNAQRPAEIHIYDHPAWESLCPTFEDVGIDCIFQKELPELEDAFRELRKTLEKEDATPALTGQDDLEPGLLEAYYTAAAEFYRAAPWRRTQENLALKVECEQMPDEPWWLFITSPSRTTAGIALYRQSELQAAMENFCDDESCGHDCGHDHDGDSGHAHHGAEHCSTGPCGAGNCSSEGVDREDCAAAGCDDEHCGDDHCGDCEHGDSPLPDFGLISLYGEAFDMSIKDLRALENNHWPVACAEAHPFPFRRDGDDYEPLPVTPRELALISACLKSVPRFQAVHAQDCAGSERYAYTFGKESIALTLSWSPNDGQNFPL